jgi:hypothetical protein
LRRQTSIFPAPTENGAAHVAHCPPHLPDANEPASISAHRSEMPRQKGVNLLSLNIFLMLQLAAATGMMPWHRCADLIV